MIDPSHAAGHWQYVGPLSKAAVAVGADGLIIEVHPEPEKSLVGWSTVTYAYTVLRAYGYDASYRTRCGTYIIILRAV